VHIIHITALLLPCYASGVVKMTASTSVHMCEHIVAPSFYSLRFRRLAIVCVFAVVILTFLHRCWHHCHHYHYCRFLYYASSAVSCSQELFEGLCSERTVCDKRYTVNHNQPQMHKLHIYSSSTLSQSRNMRTLLCL
jgi:hypothetical protein